MVLNQCEKDSMDRPVAYFSKRLLDQEERYSTVEKECLAIKLAMHTFRVYLIYQQFLIQTNHQVLACLDTVKKKICA